MKEKCSDCGKELISTVYYFNGDIVCKTHWNSRNKKQKRYGTHQFK